MYSFTGILKDQVYPMWRHVDQYIHDALQYSMGEMHLSDIYQELIMGTMQLWTVVEDNERICGAVVTKIVQMPRKRILQLVCCGGENIARWIRFLQTIEEWASTLNIEEIRLYGRPGWKKLLRTEGYFQSYIVLSKDVGAENEDPYTNCH